MVEQTVTSEDIIAFMNPLLSANDQFVAKNYFNFITRALPTPDDKNEIAFAETDFCYTIAFLMALERRLKGRFEIICTESHLLLKLTAKFLTIDNGGTFLGLPNKREEVVIKNGKSDIIAKKYLQLSQKYCDKKEFEKALRAVNKAYFSAFSEDAKFDSLSKRCYFLLQLDYYAEFLQDAVSCLEANTSITKKKVIYLLLSKFYNQFDNPEKSKFYLEKAYKTEMKEEERKDDVETLRGEIDKPSHYGVKWKCIHPEPPESLLKFSEPTSEKTKRDIHRIREDMASKKVNLLRVTDTESDKGWAVNVTKKVPIGSILLKEKPYASVLSSQFTRYCYCCYKRCVNILPCKGCAMVGFCSEKCAEDASNPNLHGSGGPGRHVYDCGGLLPCLRLDRVGESEPEVVEKLPVTHLAYTCVANTPPEVLLDCICSSGRYKVEILFPFCLSGYPMKWFDEAGKVFYKDPSELEKRPDILPASWVAACMVYHYRSVRFNAQRYTELLESPTSGQSFYNWLAFCIYPTISFINHDCNPNACLAFTANGGAYLYALRQIEPGEEISISYGYYYFSHYSTPFRKDTLKARYLFDCKCTACCNCERRVLTRFLSGAQSTNLRMAIQWKLEYEDSECGCERLDLGLSTGALSSHTRQPPNAAVAEESSSSSSTSCPHANHVLFPPIT
ncbi:unnamed protein product [Rodentolepis nana]|uniref:SET domain-containing protein n=1 Tax=Rodentolepis nana TaxID=102285 RepID=A0A0R3T691_RODNA|nr:unnamed protein product [Rodentolepis nana]